MPYRVKGIATLRYSDEEMAIAGLTPDGQHVQAWVTRPTGKVWEPHDRDPLLWLPPSATKSTDLDEAGRIVDVTWDIGEERAFVTSQLAKHNRYLATIRERVRAGTLKLTAALARTLGLPFDDGVELAPRSGVGPFVYGKAATVKMIEEGRRMALNPPPRQHRSWCVTGHPLDVRCETQIGG